MLSDAGVNWLDMDVLSDTGVNWVDVDVLSDMGVNWWMWMCYDAG